VISSRLLTLTFTTAAFGPKQLRAVWSLLLQGGSEGSSFVQHDDFSSSWHNRRQIVVHYARRRRHRRAKRHGCPEFHFVRRWIRRFSSVCRAASIWSPGPNAPASPCSHCCLIPRTFKFSGRGKMNPRRLWSPASLEKLGHALSRSVWLPSSNLNFVLDSEPLLCQPDLCFSVHISVRCRLARQPFQPQATEFFLSHGIVVNPLQWHS